MAYFRAVREGLTDACAPAVRLLRTEETSLKKLPFISPLFVIVLAVALTGCGDKVGGNAGNLQSLIGSFTGNGGGMADMAKGMLGKLFS